jgi:hypothetical protein
VLNNNSQFIPPRRAKFPVVGLLITCGILGFSIVGELNKTARSSTALAVDLPISNNQIVINSQPSPASKQLAVNTVSANYEALPNNTNQLRTSPLVNFPEKDGVYLYGQSPQPNQLGQGYIVFSKHNGRVSGALYMPSSEFSCFQGTIAKSGELAMTVTSPAGEAGSIEVSTASRIPQIRNDEATTYAYSLALQDYHRLNSISANDRKILQMCNQSSGGNEK